MRSILSFCVYSAPLNPGHVLVIPIQHFERAATDWFVAND